jgi:anti-sigma factor RsiW
MKVLNCAAARRRLDAFHDRELSVTDQIAVASHLEWCDECAALSADMHTVGAALRAAAPGRASLSHEEAVGFSAMVVTRLKTERALSFGSQINSMFEDLHFVYAGLGATIAASICLVLIVGILHFSTSYRPDSLAAILKVMATPLICETTAEIPDALACQARWLERFERANKTAEQEAVFTLDAVVMHEGQLATLASLRASRHDSASDQAQVIEEMLDVVYRARSMPQFGDSTHLLRFVARETVRATKPSLDQPLPPSKPAASLVEGSRRWEA